MLYLAATLRKEDPTSQIAVTTTNDINTILAYKPDVVALSFVSADLSKAKTAASAIRTAGIPVLGGGAHLTSSPETLPKEMCLGLIGEGEDLITSLVKAATTGTINDAVSLPGVIYHNGDGVSWTTPKRVQDLNAIPFPARDLLPQTYWSTGITSLLTSRGCPYHCAFCQVSAIWKQPKFHSAEYVVSEIEEVHKKFGIHTFGVVDDLFIANRNRIQDITDLLSKRNLIGRVGFAVNGRSNLITKDLCRDLKEMGVREVALGIESMSKNILPKLKDRVTVEQNIEAVEIIHASGLKAGGLFMIGTPTETLEDMAESYDYVYNNREKFGGLQVCVTTPLPGTALWNTCADLGKVNKIPTEQDWSKMNIAAEDPRTNMYVGDVPIETFHRALTKFRTLFFGKKENADPSLLPLEIGIDINNKSMCTGIGDDGWTDGHFYVTGIKDQSKPIKRIVVKTRPWTPEHLLDVAIKINAKEAQVSSITRTRIVATVPQDIRYINSIEITSKTFVPKDIGLNDDNRTLSINIERIILE